MKMPEKRELGEIALCLLGITFIVRAIANASSLAEIFLSDYPGSLSIGYFLPFAVYVVAGTLLLTLRRGLSRELFG